MPRIITFTNQKGGVGKTTSALNVAAALAEKNHKVLLIDLDPQGNLSQSLLQETPRNTIFTVLLEECELEEVAVPIHDNLVLIPCNDKFANFEKYFAADAESQFKLQGFIEDLLESIEGDIDFILIDTPPALGLITLNALVASSEVYIPMNSQEYSLIGFEKVMKVCETIKKRINKDLKVKGAFFTRHNPRKTISKDLTELLKEKHPEIVMDTHIRVNVSLEESPSARQSIFAYDPEANGAKDYIKLTEEIINR